MTDTTPRSLGPGTTLGDLFTIDQRIGRGGMGEVYLAKDLVLGRKVAVKVVRPNLAKRVEVDASFRREARFLSRLNHPNIVTIHSFGHLPPDLHYIVMEYVEGEPIESLLKRHGVLSPGLFCQVLAQICGALSAAHALGIVHQDLKPANILVTSIAGNPNFVKVLDFGLAQVFGHGTEAPGEEQKLGKSFRGGTPAYMSPEHVMNREVDGRSDVYSLAVLSCELLTGHVPITGTDMIEVMKAQVKEEPRLPSELRPDLAIPRWGELDKVFERALNKSPLARYQGVDDFARDLLPAVLRWAGLEEHPPSLAIPYLSRSEFSLSDSQEVVLDEATSARTTLYTLLDTEQLSSGLERGRSLRNISVLELGFEVDPYDERVDVDEYMECLHLVRNRIIEAITLRDGFVLGPLTHTQQALFGLNNVGDNSAEQAVDAALQIQALLQSLERDPTIPEALVFEVRIGIDTGEVILSESRRGALVVQGAPVFRANQLRLAKHGGVLISRSVARRLRNRYDTSSHSCESTGVSGYQVLRKRRGEPAPGADKIHGVSLDFIGREEELAQVHGCYTDLVEEGTAQAILIHGPTGTGKARLISKFLGELAKQDPRPRIEFGRCSSQQEGHPYEPFADILRHQINLSPEDTAESTSQKIGHFVRIFFEKNEAFDLEETEKLIWVIGQLLGQEEGEGLKDQDKDMAAHNALLFSMLIKMFERMTEGQPTVVYIQEMQWATEATRQLLGLIIERLYDRSLLFILTERSTPGKTLHTNFVREESQLSLIPLEPLNSEDCTELVAHALRQLVEVPTGLVRQIVNLAAGNPLVAIETIQDLIDDGTLEVEGERWRLTTKGKVRLPDSVESLFSSRLKNLPRPQRKALEVAAVAGQSFAASLLTQVLGEDLDPSDLDALIERGWLNEDSTAPTELRFAQAAVAETIYRGLSSSRRRELHASIVHHLRDLSNDEQNRMSGRMAHHFNAMGSFRDALNWSEIAALRATRLMAFEEAHEFFALALQCLDKIGEDTLTESDKRALELRIGHELIQQQVISGRLEDAVTSSQMLLAGDSTGLSSASSDHLALVETGRGRALEQLGRYPEALTAFESAEKLVDHVPESTYVLLLAITGQAGAHLKMGAPEKAAEMLESALGDQNNQAPPDRSTMESLCRAYRVLGNAKVRTQDFAAAEQWYTRAENLASTAGAPTEIVDALNGLAACHYFQGAQKEATQTWESALKVAENWDLVQHRAVLLGNLGELALSEEQKERSLDLLNRAEALHGHLRSDEGIAECAKLLAQCYASQQNLQDAESAYRRSLEASIRSASDRHKAEAHQGLAETLEKRWPKPERSSDQRSEIIDHYTSSLKAYEATRDDASTATIRKRIQENQA